MSVKIFVVEDNPDSRDMIAYMLRLQGYEVWCAGDGLEAIEQLQSQRPDIIITDIQMPNLDGIELIKRLRQQPEMRAIPILVMSAYRSGMIQEALAAGATASTRKPVQVDTLLQTVRELLPLLLLLLVNLPLHWL